MANCNEKIGPQGPRGLLGEKGATGASGAVGPIGPQGGTGLQGLVGITGPKGSKGTDGIDGLQGVQGPAGTPGIDGLQGIVGPTGSPGATGAPGINGTPGAQGVPGVQGIQGVTGATGANGSDAFSQAFQAEGEPIDVALITPALGVTDLCDASAVLQTIPQIYDDSQTYNPTTGIWTVGATGRYDLSFFASLTILTGWSNGRVRAGIAHPTSCIFYCVNAMELSVNVERAQVSGSAFGLELNLGDQLAMKIVNATATSYTTVAGDVVRFTARKVG